MRAANAAAVGGLDALVAPARTVVALGDGPQRVAILDYVPAGYADLGSCRFAGAGCRLLPVGARRGFVGHPRLGGLLRPGRFLRLVLACALGDFGRRLGLLPCLGGFLGRLALGQTALFGVLGLQVGNPLGLGVRLGLRLDQEDVEEGLQALAQEYAKAADGDPASAPYDVIVLNGATEIEPGRLLGQLAEGGRLVGVFAATKPSRAMVVTHSQADFGRRTLFDYSQEYPQPYIPRSLTCEISFWWMPATSSIFSLVATNFVSVTADSVSTFWLTGATCLLA
jgi:hypothetical protein